MKNNNLLRLAFPFIDDIKNYSLSKFSHDIQAAATVALIALPQAMAYALIAGVSPQYGIYAVIVGSVVGALFGFYRYTHTGPVNTSSIVVAATMAPFLQDGNYWGLFFLLGFLAGFFQFFAALLRLGNLAQFISRSVILGFTTGAGLLIAVNQLPNAIGIPKESAANFMQRLNQIILHIDSADLYHIAVALGTIVLILLIQRYSFKSESGLPYLPAHLIAVLVMAFLVYYLGWTDKGIELVGKIDASLPPLSLPEFSWSAIYQMSSGGIALALIMTAEIVASTRSNAAISGDKTNLNRELYGQGLAKMVVSFFSGMPVSASFTRTLLNYRAGAQTRFASAISGFVILMLILLFSDPVAQIPLAALAGMIILIAVRMINWKAIIITLRITPSDALAFIGTFLATLLLPLDTAIFIGVATSLIMFLRRVQYPRVIELCYDEKTDTFDELPADSENNNDIVIVHLEGDMFFGGADFLEEEMMKIAKRKHVKAIILRLKRAVLIDATSIMAMMQFASYMKHHGKILLVSGMTDEEARLFERSGLEELVGKENLFYSGSHIFGSTKKALKRARELLTEHNKTAEDGSISQRSSG